MDPFSLQKVEPVRIPVTDAGEIARPSKINKKICARRERGRSGNWPAARAGDTFSILHRVGGMINSRLKNIQRKEARWDERWEFHARHFDVGIAVLCASRSIFRAALAPVVLMKIAEKRVLIEISSNVRTLGIMGIFSFRDTPNPRLARLIFQF